MEEGDAPGPSGHGSTSADMETLLPTSALENNDLDDVSRRPPTEYSDNDDTFSVMPWWPVGSGDSVTCYHMNTRLPDGRVSIIVDTGAWGNLSGEEWAQSAAAASQRAGYPPSQHKMDNPVHVQ